MSILVLLWVGTLSVIYASSYFEMKQQNKQMLQTHAQMYTLPQSFEQMMPPGRPTPGGDHGFKPGFDPESPKFQLSTFYTVAVSYNGDVLVINNEPPTVYSNEDLKDLAQDIIGSGKSAGTQDIVYLFKVIAVSCF